MKAFILAGGFGTRLRPLTDNTPKVLMPLVGKPLLEYHLDSLSKYGVTEVFINTHYLAEKVEEFVAVYSLKNPLLKVSAIFEPELLGSAGTLQKNSDLFRNEKEFIIVYGDNLTNIHYSNFLDFHRKKNGIVTVASYYEKDPSQKGIIVFDENQKIKNFIEKPAKELIISNYANAGIYVCNPLIFKYLDIVKKNPLDFGHDVFPFLLEQGENMYAYLMSEFLLDIGTPETYERAQTEIPNITF